MTSTSSSWMTRYKQSQEKQAELARIEELKKYKTASNAWSRIVRSTTEQPSVNTGGNDGISNGNSSGISSGNSSGISSGNSNGNKVKKPVVKYVKSPYSLHKSSWNQFINAKYYMTDNFEISVGEWMAIFVGTYLQPFIESGKYQFICSGKEVANCLMNHMYEMYYSNDTHSYSCYTCKHHYYHNEDYNIFINKFSYLRWENLKNKMVEYYDMFKIDDKLSEVFWCELPYIVFSHIESSLFLDGDGDEGDGNDDTGGGGSGGGGGGGCGGGGGEWTDTGGKKSKVIDDY